MLVTVLLVAAARSASADTIRLDLEMTVARVERVSPAIAAAAAAAQAPAGARSASLLPLGATGVEYSTGTRTGPGVSGGDREWRITQDVDISGQSFALHGAADRRVAAAESWTGHVRLVARREARVAYSRLAITEQRAALTDSTAILSERLAEAARRRLELGVLTQIELNVAILEATRLRNVAEMAEAGHAAAAAAMARILGLPADSVPVTTGLPGLRLLPERLPDVALLVDRALAGRPDVASARTLTAAAERDATAARRGVLPLLRLSAYSGQEGGVDDLGGVSFGLTLPLVGRNRAARGEAEARTAAAEATLLETERRAREEVTAAFARYERSRRAAERFVRQGLPAAVDNVALTERALQEGKVSLTEVVLLRAAAVNAQLEYLDIVEDVMTSWFTLAAALAVEPADLLESIR